MINSIENFYDVIDILKDGENGKVKLIYDKTIRRVCVMKQRSISNFDVYYTLKNLGVKCIPEIYKIIKSDSSLIIVEEYIDGRTLAEILQYENQINESNVADILRQICDGLKILHAENIIHRDIKPSNIMLTNGGNVKLIDFSIARILKVGKESDTEHLGTRGYASPEQYGFGQTDARSDIYSLGVTIQRLLGKNYHGYLNKIIKRCTKLDPAQRYNSIESLINDFEHRYWRWQLNQLKKVNPAAANKVEEQEPAPDVYDKMFELVERIEEIKALEKDFNAVKDNENQIQANCIVKGAERLVEECEEIVNTFNDEDYEEMRKALEEYPIEDISVKGSTEN